MPPTRSTKTAPAFDRIVKKLKKSMIVGATGHPFSIEFPVDRMSWATIAATIRAATARRSRDQMRAFTSAPQREGRVGYARERHPSVRPPCGRGEGAR